MNQDAVTHIEKAMRWCQQEYHEKVEKRRLRAVKREKARLEELEKTGGG